ncbi:hypothetical protein [Xanthomonas medicagonis]|uniref:hypothetical protein n=1 Tax=Xanthomonas medicagonis TaxID=3160841 RepID=UPI0035137EDF
MIAFIVIAMSLSGCDLLTTKYVDASEEAGVREIVSTSRTTTTELLLLGIDSYPSQKRIEYYVLVPVPGFDGPEVLSRALLPQGAGLYFTGAQRCINCSPESMRLSVKVGGFERGQPIYIDMNSMGLLE